MASVFRRSGRSSWYIHYTDHTGKRRSKCSKTTDKAVAVRIGNKLKADAALRRESLIDVRLEAFAIEGQKQIKVVLAAYEAGQMAKGVSSAHVESTLNKIESIVVFNEWSKLADLNADGVNRFSSKQRADGKAPRTIAAYIQAIKGLAKWCAKNGKLPADPLLTVSKPSSENGRKLVRRYLTHDEWKWLDATTRSSQVRFGMSGLERALLYSLAIQTGFRSGECRSLTRGSLFLTGSKPYVMADAKDTKNGKRAKQYIQRELAIELLNVTRSMLAGASVFAMPHESTVVDMVREDLHRARLAWLNTFADPQQKQEAANGDFLSALDSEGKCIDFHALRHTCGTWLAQAGVDIKTVQSIMRHSTIVLTMDRYGHLYDGAEADAVGKIRQAFVQPLAAAVNCDREPNAQHSARSAMHVGALSVGQASEALRHEKTLVSQGITKKNQGFARMRAEGLEPSTQGLKVRSACSELDDGLIQGYGLRSDDELLEIVLSRWLSLPRSVQKAVASIVENASTTDDRAQTIEH